MFKVYFWTISPNNMGKKSKKTSKKQQCLDPVLSKMCHLPTKLEVEWLPKIRPEGDSMLIRGLQGLKMSKLTPKQKKNNQTANAFKSKFKIIKLKKWSHEKTYLHVPTLKWFPGNSQKIFPFTNLHTTITHFCWKLFIFGGFLSGSFSFNAQTKKTHKKNAKQKKKHPS